MLYKVVLGYKVVGLPGTYQSKVINILFNYNSTVNYMTFIKTVLT